MDRSPQGLANRLETEAARVRRYEPGPLVIPGDALGMLLEASAVSTLSLGVCRLEPEPAPLRPVLVPEGCAGSARMSQSTRAR